MAPAVQHGFGVEARVGAGRAAWRLELPNWLRTDAAVLAHWLIVRLLIGVVGAYALRAVPLPTDPAALNLPRDFVDYPAVAASLAAPRATLSDDWATSLWRYDGVGYIAIARDGYAAAGVASNAYPPLYPLLIRVVATLLLPGQWLASALVVSAAATAIALCLLARLAQRELGGRGVLAPTLLLVFPSAFFMAAPYAEAVFLALSLGCLLAAREQRWLLAGALGCLSALTRVQGVTLLVPLLVLAWPHLRGFAAQWRVRPLASVVGPLHAGRQAHASAVAKLRASRGERTAAMVTRAAEDYARPAPRQLRDRPLADEVRRLVRAPGAERFARPTWRRLRARRLNVLAPQAGLLGPLVGALVAEGFGVWVLGGLGPFGQQTTANGWALVVPGWPLAVALMELLSTPPDHLAAAQLIGLPLTLMALGALAWGWRRLPPYLAWYGLAVLVPGLAVLRFPALAGMPRYVLLCAPAFLGLALWARTPWRRVALLVPSGLAQVALVALFARWTWLA